MGTMRASFIAFACDIFIACRGRACSVSCEDCGVIIEKFRSLYSSMSLRETRCETICGSFFRLLSWSPWRQSLVSYCAPAGALSFLDWFDSTNLTRKLNKVQTINLNERFSSNEVCIEPLGATPVPTWKYRRPDYTVARSGGFDDDPDVFWTIQVFHPEEKTYDLYRIADATIEYVDDVGVCSANLVLSVTSAGEGKWRATLVRW
jgi:hypothetical protein